MQIYNYFSLTISFFGYIINGISHFLLFRYALSFSNMVRRFYSRAPPLAKWRDPIVLESRHR